jgi:hypothetical protein
MGYDYYIERNLHIYYNDNSHNYITLNKDRGYYSDENDDFIIIARNENSNKSKWEKTREYYLTPREVPFLIYSNNSFINIYVSNQYKTLLESEMINKTWNDIKEIVILEERYERD